MAQDWSTALVETLCAALKERRLHLGLTIYQVSQSSGVSWQSVAAYEKLTRRPTLDCLANVAVALGLKPSELLALAEERVGEPKGRTQPKGRPQPKPKRAKKPKA